MSNTARHRPGAGGPARPSANLEAAPLNRVVVTSRLFSPEPAAASFRLRAVANALHRSGAAVRVLTTQPPASMAGRPDGTLPGVDVRRAPVLRDSDGYVRGYLQYLSFDVPLALRLLFSKRPAVVLTEPPPTTGAVVRVICGLRRVPYVYYAADVWADAVGAVGASGLVSRFVRWLELFALRGAARVLSVSEGVTERLTELGISESVRTIGNGVDLTAFAPVGSREALDGPVLLYAGTASEVHGAGIFLAAFRRVLQERPDARLVYLGQGSDRAEIEAKSRSFPEGSVRFLPRADPEHVGAWLRGAVASLASVRPEQDYDFAFPTKLYASAAVGTPMIFTGVGPGADFVRACDGGWAVPYAEQAVANAMLAALSTADARDRDARRASLAAWAAQHIGLEQVAERAVREMKTVARRTSKSLAAKTPARHWRAPETNRSEG